tara:strand:+ start:139 stop:555 length:417 start_codon:yes stop_codon:yes gene_type:complete
MTLTRLQKKDMNDAANILMNIKNSNENININYLNENIINNSYSISNCKNNKFKNWNILMRYINNWKKFVINKKNELEKNKLKLIKHELNELQEIKHLKDLLEIKKNIIQFHIAEFNEIENKISKSKIQYRMNYPNPKI